MADWKQNLGRFFEEPEKRAENESSVMAHFVTNVALPAFEEIASELRRHHRDVTIRESETSAAIIVCRDGEEELSYRIQGRTFPTQVLPYAEIRFRERKGLKLITVESMFRCGSPDYVMADITKDVIMDDFVDNYARRVRTN